MEARLHPLAIVTAALLVLAFAVCLQFPQPLQVTHVVATTFLVSPLLFLLWAHVHIATSRGQNAWLALCAIPLAFLSYFSAFLMSWFKPGWYGVLVFAALLSTLAGICILLVRRRREPNAA